MISSIRLKTYTIFRKTEDSLVLSGTAGQSLYKGEKSKERFV